MNEIRRKYLQKLGQSNDHKVHERGFIVTNIVLYEYSKEKKHEKADRTGKKLSYTRG